MIEPDAALSLVGDRQDTDANIIRTLANDLIRTRENLAKRVLLGMPGAAALARDLEDGQPT